MGNAFSISESHHTVAYFTRYFFTVLHFDLLVLSLLLQAAVAHALNLE